MFEELTIKGFQAHKNLTICFDPHITVITGPNNVGKSAVIRALRWVCLNRKPNTNFTTWDKNNTIVKLKIDGKTITRKKIGNKNVYKLGSQVYKAFSIQVPSTISQLLNISETNFQRQHDSPFWFSLSPGQISKELNSIVNLQTIDSSLSAASSEIRKAESELDVIKERVKNARKQRKELKWVVKADKLLLKLERKHQKIVDFQSKHTRLESLIYDVQRLTSMSKTMHKAAVVGQKLQKKLKSSADCANRVKKLQSIVTDINKLETERCRLLKRTKEINLQLSKVKMCPVCKRPLKKTQ